MPGMKQAAEFPQGAQCLLLSSSFSIHLPNAGLLMAAAGLYPSLQGQLRLKLADTNGGRS